MAENNAKMDNPDPVQFLNRISNQEKRNDGFAIMELMQKATGEQPEMWGKEIIGFGRYQYKFPSGKEGEWFLVGFTARKQKFTLYIMPGFKKYEKLLAKLGPYRRAKSRLHVNNLADIDLEVLEEIVKRSAKHMKEIHKSKN